MYAYVDGIVPLHEARVPLLDRGYLLGDGIFETMRTTGGRIWQEARHRERFERGAQYFGLDASAWDTVVPALVDAMGQDARIRVQLTAGDMDGITTGTGSRMTGSAVPFVPHEGTISVVTTDVPLAVMPWAGCKTLGMQAYLQAKRQALAVGADDGLLCNGNQVVEGATSNVFAWVDGAWHSPGPEQGAVDGITRQLLSEIVPVTPELSRKQLSQASHLVLTNTTGLRIAHALDGRTLDIGGPAAELMTTYEVLQ